MRTLGSLAKATVISTLLLTHGCDRPNGRNGRPAPAATAPATSAPEALGSIAEILRRRASDVALSEVVRANNLRAWQGLTRGGREWLIGNPTVIAAVVVDHGSRQANHMHVAVLSNNLAAKSVEVVSLSDEGVPQLYAAVTLHKAAEHIREVAKRIERYDVQVGVPRVADARDSAGRDELDLSLIDMLPADRIISPTSRLHLRVEFENGARSSTCPIEFLPTENVGGDTSAPKIDPPSR
jgi:hypothetical protein